MEKRVIRAQEKRALDRGSLWEDLGLLVKWHNWPEGDAAEREPVQ